MDSLSIPKRPCSSSSSSSATTPSPFSSSMDSVDLLLEAFLSLPASSLPSALFLALDKIVGSQVSSHEKNLVVDSAIRLGSALLDSAQKSAIKLAAAHNTANWPLSLDLTVKVFSMLDTKSQCYVSATCTLFNKAMMDPSCYANIDLNSSSPLVSNVLVSSMILRAGKNLKSLKLGAFTIKKPSRFFPDSISNSMDASGLSWNDKRSQIRNESSGLTRSCLQSLSLDHGAAGALLRNLHLYNIEKMDSNALCSALSTCRLLLNLEVIGLHVELRQILESLSAHCHSIEHLTIESSKTGRDDSLESSTCVDLIKGCPHLTSLALRGFKLNDHKARILTRGFQNMKSVDFSTSYSITGSFLRNLGGGANCLELLMLRDCLHLKEVEVSRLLSAAISGDFKFLRYLDISNKDGLSAEEDWCDRCYSLSASLVSKMLEERPNIYFLAVFPTDQSFLDEIIDLEMSRDVSFSSQMTPDSFATISSESTDNSDRGAAHEDSHVVDSVFSDNSDELWI